MARVLTDVIGQAISDLVLVTYSATAYPPILAALSLALAGGVSVSVVVETLQGAGSALSGVEPAAAFASMPEIQLWHWPVDRRAAPGAKTHAKLAVADPRVLLLSSANLTESGIDTGLESGILVRGGSLPVRVAEYIAELMATGTLARLWPEWIALDDEPADRAACRFCGLLWRASARHLRAGRGVRGHGATRPPAASVWISTATGHPWLPRSTRVYRRVWPAAVMQ